MSTASRATSAHTIVGVFPSGHQASEAMRSLDQAGFDADRVQMVADNPSRAAEVGGKNNGLAGGVIGLVAGAAAVTAFTLAGNLGADPFGLVFGGIGVVGGFAAIGFLIGRATGRHSGDSHRFAAVVQRGGALVWVQCDDAQRGLASQVLERAGAREVRDQPGPEVL